MKKRWGNTCQAIQAGTKSFGCPLGPLSPSSSTHALFLTCSHKTAQN